MSELQQYLTNPFSLLAKGGEAFSSFSSQALAQCWFNVVECRHLLAMTWYNRLKSEAPRSAIQSKGASFLPGQMTATATTERTDDAEFYKLYLCVYTLMFL